MVWVWGRVWGRLYTVVDGRDFSYGWTDGSNRFNMDRGHWLCLGMWVSMGDWEASARRRIEQIDVRKPIDLDFLCSSCLIGLIADLARGG